MTWCAALVAVASAFITAGCAGGGKESAPESAGPQPPEPNVGVGDLAPDFTLPDQEGNPVTLSAFRGEKKVVLAFYVFAFTGG